MYATKTRCGKIQLTLSPKEAQLLHHLSYSRICGSPSYDSQFFTFIKFTEIEDTPENRKVSARSRTLFDHFNYALTQAEVPTDAPPLN